MYIGFVTLRDTTIKTDKKLCDVYDLRFINVATILWIKAILSRRLALVFLEYNTVDTSALLNRAAKTSVALSSSVCHQIII